MTGTPRFSAASGAALLGFACLLLLPVLSAAAVAPNGTDPVDLLLVNGRIFTGNKRQPWAEAVAIRADRIVATGTSAEMKGKVSARQTIDVGQRLVIPGINDAHDHFDATPFGVEAHTHRPPMADPSLAEVANAIRDAAAQAPKGAWLHIVAGKAAMASAAATRAALQPVAGDHPVLVNSWWGHGFILNDTGLSALGLGPQSIDPLGGHYERDAAGRLTGKLEEYAGWRVFRRLQSSAGLATATETFRAYAARRLAEGVTSVQIMADGLEPEMFARVVAEAGSPLRVRLIPFPMPDEQDPDGMAAWRRLERQIGPTACISGIKWVLDGTPIDQSAWSSKPYQGRPDCFGHLNFAPAFVERQLAQALAGGDQLMLHAAGDATNVFILDTMERLAPAASWRPRRVRIEHSQDLRGEKLRRAVALGIIVAQPRPTAPLREMLAAGLTVAYGSDIGFAPFVAFQRMTSATNPQAVSREEALLVLTRAGALAEFAETEKGVIQPGMLADLTVLTQDVLTAAEAELPTTRSLLTIVGGKITYREPEF